MAWREGGAGGTGWVGQVTLSDGAAAIDSYFPTSVLPILYNNELWSFTVKTFPSLPCSLMWSCDHTQSGVCGTVLWQFPGIVPKKGAGMHPSPSFSSSLPDSWDMDMTFPSEAVWLMQQSAGRRLGLQTSIGGEINSDPVEACYSWSLDPD